jgi:4-hydroxybenzoyl-CoA reductase subunit beta
MLLPAHEFVKPASLEEGLAVLSEARETARVLGGGTDVVFNMRNRLMTPAVLLSVRELPELIGVEERSDGTIRIGAGTRLTDLVGDPLLGARYPALAAAFRAVASTHVRNMATLGGNLNLDTRCWYTNQTQEWRAARGGCLKTGVSACHVIRTAARCVAINNADTPPALIALDAQVTLARAGGRRTLPLAGYYRSDGTRHTVREPDEILTEVVIPPTADRLVYIKDAARQGIDFAYGTIAARAGPAAQGVPGRVTLVLGSLGPAPVVLRRPAEIAMQHGLADTYVEAAADAVREELGPLNNLYTPAAYKRELARTLVRRALVALREA